MSTNPTLSKVLSTAARIYDIHGLLAASGLTVIIDDDIVTIGNTAHPIDDVKIDLKNKRITSKHSSWMVAL